MTEHVPTISTMHVFASILCTLLLILLLVNINHLTVKTFLYIPHFLNQTNKNAANV
jgi:hypothetical protein